MKHLLRSPREFDVRAGLWPQSGLAETLQMRTRLLPLLKLAMSRLRQIMMKPLLGTRTGSLASECPRRRLRARSCHAVSDHKSDRKPQPRPGPLVSRYECPNPIAPRGTLDQIHKYARYCRQGQEDKGDKHE